MILKSFTNRTVGCILIALLFCLALQAQAQTSRLAGRIVDKETQTPLSNVSLILKNTAIETDVLKGMTDHEGNFSFPKIKTKSNYLLTITCIGYSDLEIAVAGDSPTTDLGILYLSAKTQSLVEIVVKGDASIATQKGDTVVVNANAFKTTADATAEDLLKKMPGIKSENGEVTANGKTVKKVMVDGKEFFGEDPSVALKSLPAEVIDKIQVFDKLSEQAQFSGFDDGDSDQTINIITKKDKKVGKFGKFSGGSDFDDKYIAGGNLNLFNKQRRFTVSGLFNNVNQQNFAQQDLLSATSSSVSSKQNGGFSIAGPMNGVTTTQTAGFNYSENFGKDLKLTGSYLFNATQNLTEQTILKDKFLAPKPDHYSTENDTITDKRFNHHIHMRLEYDINPANTLILTSKLSFQSSHTDKSLAKITTKNEGQFVNADRTTTNGSIILNDIYNELAFRHSLNKPRRLFSIALVVEAINKDPDSYQIGYYKKTLNDSLPTNEYVNELTNSFKISSKMEYIEPIGRISNLRFNLTNAYTNSQRNRQAYDLDNQWMILGRIDSLSAIHSTEYFNNHVGMAYQIKDKGFKLSAGLEVQRAYMILPTSTLDDKIFTNLLPNFMINMNNAQNSFKLLYKTSTNSPSNSQLRSVIDNTDRTNLVTGNANLTQEYMHDVTVNYSHANPNNSTLYTFYLEAAQSLNFIGNKTYKAAQDTFIREANLVLLKNIELSYPVNIDHCSFVRSVFNFGFPAKFIISKINLTTGFNYTQTPGYINDNLNRYNLYNTIGGISVNSDVSKNVDFELAYNVNYSKIRNSISMSAINENNNPDFLYQTFDARFTVIFWKGLVIHNEMIKRIEKDFLNFNQTDLLWNGYLGKKLFKDQNGEIRIGFFDLLNQYKNIIHTVTPQYIKDTRTNSLGRFVMLTFTYNLNSFKGQANSDEPVKEKKDHKKDPLKK